MTVGLTLTRAPLPTSDAVLAARHRSGDPGAFACLHDRYAQGLLRLAQARVGVATAEDTVQDAFERAHRFLMEDPRARAEDLALGAWLHTVVRNRCHDELRRSRRQRTLTDELPCSGPEPHQAAEAQQTVQAVLIALTGLPARQRLALVAHAIDGHPHTQVARQLDTTVPATKALVNRARGALHDRLAA